MEPTRVFDLLDRYREKFGNKPDTLVGKEKGEWKKWSFETFSRTAHEVAAGLIATGIQRGDRVAIIANNRPEWNIIDFGAQLCGAILVPIYPTIAENDLQFILGDCEAKAVFVSSKDICDKTKTAEKDSASHPVIYVIDPVPGERSWTELTEKGKQDTKTAEIEAVKREMQPDDVCTILYTSGTTGTPKGVMLTHKNLVSNFTSLCDLPPVDHTSRVLSFLPLNHSYERIIIYLYLYRGPSVYYAESLDTISDNIREVQPHMFTCVPALVQKVYNRIVSKGAELTGFKRWLFFWSLGLAEKYDVKPGVNGAWYKFRLSIASKLVFSKWREALGGNVRAMVSGGAALDTRLARIFWAAGIPVLEGYGLTETSPVIAVNNLEPGGVRFGTVGPLIKGEKVKFAEDGEILVKGDNVMKGYYKRPEATAEVIDSEGWFHTGDIGMFEDNKYLKITDRKKEIFKTAGGKYIAPQHLENLLKASRFVEQSMAVGENRKYPTALIVPNFAFVREWAKRKGIPIGETNEEIAKNPAVQKRVQAAVEKLNAALAQYEKIKKITLLPKEWSVAGGELTPKLSLRRKIILKNNEAVIEEMYKE